MPGGAWPLRPAPRGSLFSILYAPCQPFPQPPVSQFSFSKEQKQRECRRELLAPVPTTCLGRCYLLVLPWVMATRTFVSHRPECPQHVRLSRHSTVTTSWEDSCFDLRFPPRVVTGGAVTPTPSGASLFVNVALMSETVTRRGVGKGSTQSWGGGLRAHCGLWTAVSSMTGP